MFYFEIIHSILTVALNSTSDVEGVPHKSVSFGHSKHEFHVQLAVSQKLNSYQTRPQYGPWGFVIGEKHFMHDLMHG